MVLSAIIAAAAAAPSGIHGLPWAVDYTPEYHVSKVISHVPTAISHQSRIDYHHKPIITPIIAPVVKTIHAPIIKTVHAPIIASPYVHSSPWLGSPWLDSGLSYGHGW